MTGFENLGATGHGSDFTELVARFSTHAAGKIPADLACELALDVVLNEIVEQACRATGASGAAIALKRGSELVCRASSGGVAPELGSRLHTSEGLSGACVQSLKMQRCRDALTDPRADADISRRMGVRSIVAHPVLRDGELAGVLEIFSPDVNKFSGDDLRTLEVLGVRILENVEACALSQIPANIPKPAGWEVKSMAKDPKRPEASAFTALHEEPGSTTTERFDWFAAATGVVLLAVVALMVAMFSVRAGWVESSRTAHSRRAGTGAGSHGATAAANPQSPQPVVNPPVVDPQRASPLAPVVGNAARAPEGSLLVYERGKEIFRLPPSTFEAKPSSDRSVSAGTSPAAAKNNFLLHRVQPQYPQRALVQRLEGSVVIDVHIAPDGSIGEIRKIKGNPILAESAMSAVKQWRFNPPSVEGRAVEAETEITFHFTLQSR